MSDDEWDSEAELKGNEPEARTRSESSARESIADVSRTFFILP
jgi:hypothetical protein